MSSFPQSEYLHAVSLYQSLASKIENSLKLGDALRAREVGETARAIIRDKWPDTITPELHVAFNELRAQRRLLDEQIGTRSESLSEMETEPMGTHSFVATLWPFCLRDGYNAAESENFFDVNCLTPPVLWVDLAVACVEGIGDTPYIVSWIPPIARELTQDAICFEPTDSLSWATWDNRWRLVSDPLPTTGDM